MTGADAPVESDRDEKPDSRSITGTRVSRPRPQRGVAERPFCFVEKNRSLDCAALGAASLGMTHRGKPVPVSQKLHRSPADR
jgi:hypothetical protein